MNKGSWFHNSAAVLKRTHLKSLHRDNVALHLVQRQEGGPPRQAAAAQELRRHFGRLHDDVEDLGEVEDNN